MADKDEYDALRMAMFDFTNEDDLSLLEASKRHKVKYWKLNKAMKSWTPTEAQAQSYHDINFDLRDRGRPCTMPSHHEEKIAECARHYASNNTPLTKKGIQSLVEHYVSLLSDDEKANIGFKNGYPSSRWIKSFSQRNNLSYKRIQQVESCRLNAVTKHHVAEHIARLNAAFKRYGITSARQVVNMDQSGTSFQKMVGRSLRKGFVNSAHKSKNICLQKTLSAKGKLDRVTIMPVVGADGTAYRPCVIFPGKQPHYRVVNGVHETIHDSLMPCHLYYNETSAANSEIIFDWGKKFVEETKEIRKNGNHMVLILDGYGGHIQFNFLKYLKDNNIVVIALPAHTSHVLQPLDLTVFGPYKSYLEEELHRVARISTKLNAFSVAVCIWNAYCKAFVPGNIRSGFVKCGVWNMDSMQADVTALEYLFVEKESEGELPLSVVIKSFEQKERSLLRDVDVEEEGRIRVSTTSGAHVTSDAVLEALKERCQRREKASAKKALSSLEAHEVDVTEGVQALRRYANLADGRHSQRKRLRESRLHRREARRTRARSSQQS